MSRNQNITRFFAPPKRPRLDEDASDTIVLQTPHTNSSKPCRRPSPAPVASDHVHRHKLEDERVDGPDSSGSVGPFPTSSQRVTKNGEVMIRNSDDESDSEGSLEDLDELLGTVRPGTRSSTTSEPGPLQTRSAVKRKSARHAHHAKPAAGARDGLLNAPKYKFSLGSLIARVEREDAAEASIVQALGLVEPTTRSVEALLDMKPDQLSTVVQNHGGVQRTEKLMNAIHRTEALRQRKFWSFFGEDSDHRKTAGRRAIKHHPPEPLTSETSGRDSTFADAFIAETVDRNRLPDDWILGSSTTGARGWMRTGYRSSHPLTPSQINSLFLEIGASADAVDLGEVIMPLFEEPRRTHDDVRDWSRLHQVLRLLANTAFRLGPDSRRHAICILCRLSLDTVIFTESQIVFALEDTFEAMIDAIPESELELEISAILKKVYTATIDDEFRLRLIRCIPPSSSRLCTVRRRLALAWFFGDTVFLTKQSKPLVRLAEIRNHLRSQPQFSIRPDTDYARLKAVLSIVDIGLDDGDPPGQGVKEDVDRFNTDVDRLAKTVKGMFAQIVDTGTSHVTRTEVKDVLEGLNARLEYAVRTKPKPKRDLWGKIVPEAGHKMGGGDFMRNFLAQRQRKQEPETT